MPGKLRHGDEPALVCVCARRSGRGFTYDQSRLGAGEKFVVGLAYWDSMSHWDNSVKNHTRLTSGVLTYVAHESIMGTMTQQTRRRHDAIPPVTLGLRIRMALDYAGLNQDELMSKFEVSRKTVSRWCNNAGPAPKKFILNEIAVMCDVSPRWLIDGVVPAEPSPSRSPGRN